MGKLKSKDYEKTTWCWSFERRKQKMKRFPVFLCGVLLVFLMSGLAFASSLHHEVIDDRDFWVSTDDSTPAFWADLDLPSWYDSDYVTSFDITLTGDGDNTDGYPINVFLGFDGHSSYTEVASHDVEQGIPFTLILDIDDNALWYNGTKVGSLSNVSLGDFDGKGSFSVGYACHFWHRSTELDISQVPIPGAVWLLGSGLVGLVGLRKKFNK
jgi:hypothetical protein